MRCPFCGMDNTRVIDSRPADDNYSIRRRRQCDACGKRFTTYEKAEITPLTVIKKDQSRESYDRNKIMAGVLRACHKRPIPVEKMEDKYGVFCPIVSVTCHFKRAARMGDTLTATAEVVRPPLAKLIVRQTVINQDGELCAEGEVVLGFIDKDTFRPVRCPEELYELFTDNT